MLELLDEEYNCRLLSRGLDKVEIEIDGEMENWFIIKTNEFSSEKKMMSTVVKRESDNVIMCYVKGADSHVYNLIKNPGKQE